MEGARFIERLRLKNLLSFGEAGIDLALEPLNVLIGPNGSGKSNLIEALSLLQAAPGDITVPIRQGGGIAEWLWKGAQAPPTAELEASFASDLPTSHGRSVIRFTSPPVVRAYRSATNT